MTRNKRAVLAIAAFTLCYAGVIASLVEEWATNYRYSYGIAVIAISGYLLWGKSKQLSTMSPEPDYVLGVPVMLAGIGILIGGRLALLSSVQAASLVVTVAGLILFLFGRKIFACVQFPLGYLLVGVPIWDQVISRLQPLSQILSARIASGMLQAIGTPVLREGTKIALPNVALEVMGECSGVNQLLAIVAMALPAGYLLLKGSGRRVLLVVLAVVTAYVSNGARIALVGFLAIRGLSNGDLRGMHLFEGLVVSMIGYVALFGCLSLLAKGERAKEDREAPTGDTVAPVAQPALRPWLEVATSVTMLAMAVFQVAFQPTDVRLRDDLRTFPHRIGDWTLDAGPQLPGVRFPALEDEFIRAYPGPTGDRRFEALDDELVRAYRNSNGELVRLYVGYHRAQREGKELAGEVSSALGAIATPIKLGVGSDTVEIRQVLRDTTERRQGLLYWYDLDGRVTSNMYVAKGLMVWEALTRRQTNGAVVMIAWESPETADATAAQQRAVAFARAVLPLLPNFIPS